MTGKPTTNPPEPRKMWRVELSLVTDDADFVNLLKRTNAERLVVEEIPSGTPLKGRG